MVVRFLILWLTVSPRAQTVAPVTLGVVVPIDTGATTSVAALYCGRSAVPLLYSADNLRAEVQAR